jgi:hypothetical protein
MYEDGTLVYDGRHGPRLLAASDPTSFQTTRTYNLINDLSGLRISVVRNLISPKRCQLDP